MNAKGVEIRNKEHLERIRALAIPPAWEDVWISPNPGARTQGGADLLELPGGSRLFR